MTGSRAADVLVRCLEAEGVRHVFGIPGHAAHHEVERARRAARHRPRGRSTRLGTAFVTVVWEDNGFGSIAWKQRRRFDAEHFATDFANPDLVGLAESFGMPAWRCDSASDFGRRLRHALTLDGPTLIVLPIDYSVDVAMSDELGAQTVIRT